MEMWKGAARTEAGGALSAGQGAAEGEGAELGDLHFDWGWDCSGRELELELDAGWTMVEKMDGDLSEDSRHAGVDNGE